MSWRHAKRRLLRRRRRRQRRGKTSERDTAPHNKTYSKQHFSYLLRRQSSAPTVGHEDCACACHGSDPLREPTPPNFSHTRNCYICLLWGEDTFRGQAADRGVSEAGGDFNDRRADPGLIDGVKNLHWTSTAHQVTGRSHGENQLQPTLDHADLRSA